jgi:uncharacterized protein (DUF488 family)
MHPSSRWATVSARFKSSSRRYARHASRRSSTSAASPAPAATRSSTRGPLRDALAEAGIGYRHAVELGGRRRGEPGEEAFGCLRVAAFRSYAARMRTDHWQAALAAELAQPALCFMCAETDWRRCHRRLIAELLTARGFGVSHLLGPGRREPHGLYDESEIRENRLFICGAPVA